MIVFYNPHVDDLLAEPPHFRLLKRRALKKYGFVIDQTLQQSSQIHVVVDGTVSAFISEYYFYMLPRFLRAWISQAEFACWTRVNGLGGKVVRINPQSDDHSGSVLLMFSYKGATGRLFPERMATLSIFPAVVVHLSHYFISTSEKSANLNQLENVWLAGDSDISANPYFQHFFSWYHKPFLVLPFAVAQRFEVRKPFIEREVRCIATGSFHKLDEEVPRSRYEDFQRFFNLNTYHPVRKMIHEQAAVTGGVLVSQVSPYRSKAEVGWLTRWLNHFSVTQKVYFSINIVDLYNRYRFAVVGEESSGFPALGAFEAMACGAILIADPKYYSGLGFQSGVHYLTHDGSIEGIVSAMHGGEEVGKTLHDVAEAGRMFVEDHFRPTSAYIKWLDGIEKVIAG